MAANLLGLSEQVPAKAVFPTDGPDRLVAVDPLTVQLKQRSLRKVGKPAATGSQVFAALRSLGKDFVSKERVAHLREATNAKLSHGSPVAGFWIFRHRSDLLFKPRRLDVTINRMQATVAHYRKLLGTLEGDDFEEVVCERLQAAYIDFQPIPRKPQGDGGLDGLSHAQERCYCCYGPEQDPFKMNTKGLKADIIAKFRNDLRKIFELKTNGRNELIHNDSKELPTIMADNRLILSVFLLVSVFDTHQIIGPLNTSFEQYKNASKCRFISKDATLTIWGPTQISNIATPDEFTIFKTERRALLKTLQAHALEPIEPGNKQDFDKKFDYLKSLNPSSQIHNARMNRLQDGFRTAWGTALALEKQLSETSVSLHQSLEQARAEGTILADLKSAQSSDPLKLVETMISEMESILKRSFETPDAPNLGHTARGEVARLIGECPLEWRP